MNQVKLRHPDLDEVITVAESAAPIHMASGWMPVGDEPAETPTPGTPEGAADGDSTPAQPAPTEPADAPVDKPARTRRGQDKE